MKTFEQFIKENNVEAIKRSLAMALKRRLGSKGWDVSANATFAIAMKKSGLGVVEEAKSAISEIVKNANQAANRSDSTWKKSKLVGGWVINYRDAIIAVVDNGEMVKITVS